MTRFFEFFSRGLEARAERCFLIASVVLVLGYFLALGFFEVSDIPLEIPFFAQRDAVRIAHALANPLPAGQSVEVSNGVTISPHVAILEGWSQPEAFGIWSEAKVAGAGIAIPNPSLPAMLLLKLGVMLDADGVQTLRLYGNGQLLGSWTFTAREAVLRVALRAGVAAPNGLVKLEFDIGRPTQPPGSGDSRTLGIALDAVEFRELN